MRFARKSGLTRTAIIVGPFVLKIPTLYIFKAIFTRSRYFRSRNVSMAMSQFVIGLVSNLTETLVWRVTKADFLSPVVLSLGLVVVQRYEGERVPTDEELQACWRSLPTNAQKELALVDGHQVDRHNFRITQTGRVRMIDYGGNIGSTGWPISSFLGSWHEDISVALRTKPTA